MPIRDILVVDDSRAELHHLRDILGHRGFAVRTAENAEQALQRLGEALPDLILMDVVLPGTSGYQLTRRITRDPRFSAVPVIMCSGKGERTDRVWGLRQGASDYIVKPFDTDELLCRIRACEA